MTHEYNISSTSNTQDFQFTILSNILTKPVTYLVTLRETIIPKSNTGEKNVSNPIKVVKITEI